MMNHVEYEEYCVMRTDELLSHIREVGARNRRYTSITDPARTMVVDDRGQVSIEGQYFFRPEEQFRVILASGTLDPDQKLHCMLALPSVQGDLDDALAHLHFAKSLNDVIEHYDKTGFILMAVHHVHPDGSMTELWYADGRAVGATVSVARKRLRDMRPTQAPQPRTRTRRKGEEQNS